ncbi:MAG: anti-sigma factor [Thermodesulfobacteriota bacterium]
MNCTHCRELFSLHLDGELEPQLQVPFKAHLACCSECARDWQAFQETLAILNSIPLAKAPADLLPQIHAKLAIPAFLARLLRLFSFLEQHRFATATALTVMVVALLSSTTLLNFGPLSQPGQEILSQTIMEQGSSTAPQTTAKGSANFYPGVPYLTPGKVQTSRTGSQGAIVQFASTRTQASRDGFNSSLADRAPPQGPRTTLASLAQSSPAAKDISISIYPSSNSQHRALMGQLVSNYLWMPQIQGNTIHIKIPVSHYSSFQQIIASSHPQISHNDLNHLKRQLHDDKLLNIAINLRR